MDVKGLKFTARPRFTGPIQSYLPCDSGQSFGRITSQPQPVAYVVRSADLSRLAGFKDLVVDRGSKHRAKGLSGYLLGKKKIPLLRGDHTSAGQLIRSVRKLLANAVEKGDENVYVIGAKSEIFLELWERAAVSARAERKERMASIALPAEGKGQVPPEEGGVSTLLMDILADEEIDRGLAENYIGDSIKIRLARALAMRAARNDEPVLILGDTGTGKEIVARYIHKLSPRGGQTFIPINCAAIPRELLESELFGHRKGAFTSAVSDKMGLWQAADRGTLFLDEIADLAPEHQAKILRCLEEGKIRRLGEEKEIRVDTRVIAATNRDLYSLVQEGAFREDLYYRLRSFLIHTPALKDCPEDISPIARFLWRKITKDETASLPGEILSSLSSYVWPGNVRELKAVLSNLHSLFGRGKIGHRHVAMVIQLEVPATHLRKKAAAEKEINLHRVECLRHLRKTDEVIRASKIALRPLLRSGKAGRTPVEAVLPALRRRLEELEVLCLHPLLFRGEKTFFAVYRFKRQLFRLYRLLPAGVGEARKTWKSGLSREYDSLIKTLFAEVERLCG